MSKDTLVAKKYAKALFQVAKENNKILEVEAELKSIAQAFEQDEQIQKFLTYPNIDVTVKVNILKKVLQGKVSDYVLNTLQLIVERNRQSVLSALSDYYVQISSEAQGVANAIAYTPFPLSDQEKLEIAEQFGKIANKKIRLQTEINTDLLGGIQVHIGDRLYDGSLSGKLARLQKKVKAD